MRISTSQIYSVANIGMRDAQVAVNRTQEQLDSGKRVLSPGDDPVAATSILTMTQELSRTAQFTKNIDAADNSLTLEETTIQSILDTIQRIRELAVRAGNTAVMTAADYKSTGAEVEANLQQILALQNTRNPAGQYIFSGFQSETKPFESDSGGKFSYKGDEGQLRIQTSTSLTVAVSDSGKRVFMDVPSSNNTFNAFANSANTATPPAVINVGEVVDQQLYDKFYPQDMKITFNAITGVSPPTTNYTVTDRATGRVIVADQVFVSGKDIEINGAKFSIYGTPASGTAATPAALNFGAFVPTDFSVGPVGTQTLKLTVGGVTETFTLDQNITSAADLVTALGGDGFYPDPTSLPISASPSAIANHAKLQNLGLSLTTAGFSTPSGLNITLQGGSSDINTMMGGLATQGSGTTTVNVPFTFGAPVTFSTAPKTLDITVNGKTETLTLDMDVTDSATLAAAFNSPANLPKLAKLGVSATPDGLISKNNSVITLSKGDASIDQVTGLQTSGSGVSSSRGLVAIPGDSFIVESTNKEGLLTTTSRFSEALKSVIDNPDSKAEFAKVVAKTLANLQNAIDHMTSVQGDLGARMNMLEGTKELHTDTTLYGNTLLSQLQDLDFAEASTRLQMQTMVLSASQQSFVKISQLSLFSYL